MVEKYYTTGEFAKKSNVTVRTIRYYDKEGLLKPSFLSESGHRCYSDHDFAKLQKILSLKYLGLTLEEIKGITTGNKDGDYIRESVELQLDLIRKKKEQLFIMEKALLDTKKVLAEKEEVSWNKIITLIQVMTLEQSLINQYKDAQNTGIRIALHEQYKTNPMGWFEWLYSNYELKSDSKVLEIGCGNGELWKINKHRLSKELTITLSDISSGMVEDAKKNLENNGQFQYEVFDCHQIPKEEESFDAVIGNHLLFYLKDRYKALQEVWRILRKGGSFYCSAYGANHMKEITELVKEFDKRIVLSKTNLYEIFGLDNGRGELLQHFSQVETHYYEDKLVVTDYKALIEYILSCHGNQQEYIGERYEEFQEFIIKKMKKGKKITITKEAGMFQCKK